MNSNRGIKQGDYNPGMLLSPLETYHIHLSSTTNIIILCRIIEFSEKIIDRNSTIVTCRIVVMSNLVKKPQETVVCYKPFK